MNGYEQAIAYSKADFSLGENDFIKKLELYLLEIGRKVDENSLIVDMGCGPGNITELLARRWPSSKVIGIDDSKEMLIIAEERKQKRKFSEDLKGLSYIKENLNLFSNGKVKINSIADVLVSNSLLHHIHNPSQFWDATKNLAKNGCVIFHKDLRRPFSKEIAINFQRKYQPNAPEILKKDFLASLYAAFTIEEVKDQLNKAGLCQLKVFKVDDRYLEIIGVF